MIHLTKAIGAAIILGIFGIFLIWQGLSGNVVKTIDRKAFIPRWVYVLAGIGILILPVAYLIVLLQIK
jgi:hypothetical protein